MKILLLGKDGQVGWELQRSLAPLGELTMLGRDQANLEEPSSLRPLIASIKPNIIVNAAAYTAVDKAESEPEKAYTINAEAVGILAHEAKQNNAWLVHYSTDYVFNGEKADAYVEEDQTAPLSIYGKTKLDGENWIKEAGVRHLIFRTSWVFAPRGGNFAKTMLKLAREREQLKIVADQYGAPTSAELIADVTALTLHQVMCQADKSSSFSGTYHLAAKGETTWHEYAQYLFDQARNCGAAIKVPPDAVIPISAKGYPVAAKRPGNSRLNTMKLASTFNIHLPDWRQHVQRMIRELKEQGDL